MTQTSAKPTSYWLLYAIPAVVYIASIHLLPYRGDFVLKAIPVLLLAVVAWKYIPARAGSLLTLAFLLSACGDISLSFAGEAYFLAGLSFFLLAHILYIITFAQNYQFKSAQWPILLAIVVFSLSMASILYPKLGAMRLPVFVYILAIVSMGLFAAMWQGQKRHILLAGAIIFMLSDSMIAINRFLLPLDWSKYFIMCTYYTGQLLICAAFLPNKKPSPKL